MSSDDGGRQLVFGPDELLSADLRAGGIKVSAKLLEITKTHLKVSPGRSDVTWLDGLPVDDVRLLFAGEPFRPIGVMRVSDVRIEADGLSIVLEPSNPGARAALWLALDDIDQGEGALLGLDEDSLVDPPKIPARGIYDEDARLARLKYARQVSGAPLEAAAHTRLRAEKLTGNIENFFASV